MIEGLISIVSVIVGFALSEFSSYFKQRRRERALREALDSELSTINRMVPFKKEALSQARATLSSGRFLNTATTHFPRTVYQKLILSAPQALTNPERDCLHILYEHLRAIDTQMDNLETRFLSLREAESSAAALEMAIGTAKDLAVNLETCKKLAQSVLDKSPVQVLGS